MANQNLPTLERQTTVKESTHPDIQSAGQQLAASNNLMSTIGAQVAQAANTQMAKQLGYEAGKNPHGDIGLQLTEFDKHFAESYNTQANSVLTLQGQKLLNDAHLEMSKAPRITPELIASTQKQLDVGLKNIANNAPTAIKGQLEATFASQTLHQVSQYNEKMFTQDREDSKNNLTNASEIHIKQANELSMSGDYGGGLLHEQAAIQAADNGLKNRYYTPEQARTIKESATKSRLAGMWIHEADIAESRNKLPEFLKVYESDTHGMTHEQHQYVGQAILNHFNQKKQLKAENENILAQQMVNDIALDPALVTPTRIQDFKDNVSRLKGEQIEFKWIQALKKKQTDNSAQTNLMQNWGDARAQANAGPKLQNSTFNELVKNAMTRDKNLSLDDAENQVAGSAGSTIPIFTDSLKAKLWSGDPAQMDSAARQINSLKATHQGHALRGLNDGDNALFAQYEALRNPADPTVGAKLVIENAQNLDPAVLKVTQAKWATNVDVHTRQAKTDVDDWVLNKFGLAKQSSIFHPFRNSFSDPFLATHYSADILNKYKSFYEMTRGNDTVATKMTQEYVDNNYGQTAINGRKDWTLHPIEQTLGFTTNDGIPFIQKDILRQMEQPLKDLKESYDRKATDAYWTVEGEPKAGEPIKMTKHERAALGTITKTYDLNLMGNNFDQWDLQIITDHGPVSIFLDSPQLGLTTYTPNRDRILAEYKNSPEAYKTSQPSTLAKIGNAIIPEAHAAEVKDYEPTYHYNVKGHNSSEFKFLKGEEGLIKEHGEPALKAYKDTKGKWTIGWGHTRGVKEGDVISKDQAEELFYQDTKPEILRIYNKAHFTLNKNKVEALLSFAHHEGGPALGEMIEFLNKYPTKEEFKKEMLKWTAFTDANKVKHYHYEPFVKRRLREFNLFYK